MKTYEIYKINVNDCEKQLIICSDNDNLITIFNILLLKNNLNLYDIIQSSFTYSEVQKTIQKFILQFLTQKIIKLSNVFNKLN